MGRIQRKRTKNWKMPANAKYVGRPTKWGNPFKLSPEGALMYYEVRGKKRTWNQFDSTAKFTIKDVIKLYELWLDGKIENEQLGLSTPPSNFNELLGKDLACFCPLDSPCHVDVLLSKIQ